MDKSQVAFKPPVQKKELIRKLRPAGDKSSIGFGYRVVTEWPYMGPWVDNGNVFGLTTHDVELSIEILRAVKH